MQLHRLIAGLDEDVYELGRPGYPPPLVQALTDGCGAAPGARVLDLGAGTGKLARPLLAAGFDVVAVEPLDRMRAVLARSLGEERALAGTAEAIPLPDASVDAVICGDSYHWFDADRAPREIHRVLRPGGGVALVWRWADTGAGAAPWVARFETLLEEVRPDHPGFTDDRGALGLERHGGFTALERRRETFRHVTDADGLCAYVASITYVGLLEPARRARLLADVAELVADEPSPFGVPMFADVWLTSRR